MAEREQLLSQFVDWSRKHITGDEKGQAQIFLDRFFQAFGHPGSLDVGGSPEMRIRKAKEDGGGTSFADYVWKPLVLIEMKKRGADLSKHYRQAFDYWTRLVPNRPRYVVLCNFDRFDVYDFDRQLDTPLDSVAIEDLPQRYGPLAFLFPTNEKPTFGNDRVAVTRDAAFKLATCFNKLTVRKVDRALAQRFILQMLVSMFAEDIGLLPKYLLVKLLDECKEPADSFDILGGLFDAMNDPTPPAGGRYKGVRYFNGGLFHEPAKVELYEDETNQLKTAAAADWSKVSPEIFGTLFQHSMDTDERHAFGAHFTSAVDIMKIVKPTIVDPWTEAIESARSGKRLQELLERLTTLRVLDPACGSGNFLYLAYREMKRLESRIRERLTTDFPAEQPRLLHVNARQFFGLDINEFAIELAKVSMMIGRKLAVDELHISDEAALPLDNLDQNFRAADALLLPSESGDSVIRTPWPHADIILGNPPFLGSRYFAKERGYDYVRKVYALYPDVPKMADYCVYWFRRAHDHLPECAAGDPLVGRAGLVGTQNIRNNEAREGGLDHLVATGTIVDAVDNQPWSGEADVHVSIVNWVKTHDASLVPRIRKLWSKLPPANATKKGRQKGKRADKTYELAARACAVINSALSDKADVSQAAVLRCNTTPKRVFQGQNPANDDFMLAPGEAADMLARNSKLKDVLFPYMIGRDMLEDGTPSRWVIDFAKRDLLAASSYPEAFQHVKSKIMPAVVARAEAEKRATGKDSTRWTRMAERWWQFRDYQPGAMAAIAKLPRYVVCSRVTKRPVFALVSPEIHLSRPHSCPSLDV